MGSWQASYSYSTPLSVDSLALYEASRQNNSVVFSFLFFTGSAELLCMRRLSLEESFVELMARLPRLHAQRVAAEAAAYEQEAATVRAAHEADCAIVRKLNADLQRCAAALAPLHGVSAALFAVISRDLCDYSACLLIHEWHDWCLSQR